MLRSTISALPNVSQLSTTDKFVVDQTDATRNITVAQMNQLYANKSEMETKLEEVNTQMEAIVKYKCDNSNFASKIGSNRTLILTEDINIKSLNLTDISNLTIVSENNQKSITVTGVGYWESITLKNCSNIKFENIKFINTKCESSLIIIHSKCSNINLENCNIHCNKNGVGTGEWLDTTHDNFLNDIKINNCVFNVGRICVELMNRSDIVRYYNICISNNKFETFGTSATSDGEKIALSLVGKNKNLTILNNDFHTYGNNEWCIELNATKGAIIQGNKFIGNGRYSLHTSPTTIDGVNIFAENIKYIGNIVITDDYDKLVTVFRYTKNSNISNNDLTQLNITNYSKYNLINGNKLISSAVSGVIAFGNGCIRNTTSSNYIECTNTDQACRCILCQGEGCTENNSINDTMILPITATRDFYFAELLPAIGNVATNKITFKK